MVVDTAYYELLGVEPNATSLEIKKAYRKAAIRLHPDKNPDDPMAASNFQEVGEAYQVLSDESLRAKYDKFGKQESIPSEGFEDPSEFFSMIFGGEAFKDWIGQLSLIEELAKSAELSGYTDETNRDERKEDTNGTAKKSGEGSTQFYLDNKSHDQTPNTKKDEDVITDSADKELTKEQSEEKKRKDELEKYEEECRIKKKEMIKELSQKLIDKLSLFTETDMQADVVYSFQEKLKYEAESLKMESFGLEILHTLGSIYKTKSKIFLKNQTFFGWGGLWWSVKDKGGVFKDTFKTIATALDAQKTMQEYTTMQEDNEYHMKKEAEEKEKAQEELAKAESGLEELKSKQKEEKIEENTEDSKKQEKKEDKIPEKHTEEEVLEMEKHLLGKVLAAAWSGSKFEIQGSVRSVCDAILDDGEVPIEKRVARAKGLRIIGDVFASVKRTEAEAEEARVFEELVAEASKKREKKKPATEDKQEKQDKE